MAEQNFKEIIPNAAVIRTILTLRYNPYINPFLPKKNWQDFTSNDSISSVNFIEKSISNYLTKEIPSDEKSLSITLSGGVDSTLILGFLRKTFPDISIDAISIKFAESVDESQNALKIAEHFDTNHHVVFIENYLRELPKAISIIKLPFWDLHWYYVVKKAKTLSKFLASGDGGDELFGGYTFRYKKFLSLTNPKSTSIEKVKAYLQCHIRDRVPDQENLFNKKANFSWDSIYNILLKYFDNALSPIEQVFLADYNGKLLYNFSPVNSSINKFFQVKSLTPLLSNELILYATHMPHNQKYDEKTNVGKLPLRNILEKHNASSLITDEKLGFNVNTLHLWKAIGHDLCLRYLLNSRIVEDGWISKVWIEKYINKNELDVRYINKFMGLLAFEIWYRLFVSKEINDNTLLT